VRKGYFTQETLLRLNESNSYQYQIKFQFNLSVIIVRGEATISNKRIKIIIKKTYKYYDTLHIAVVLDVIQICTKNLSPVYTLISVAVVCIVSSHKSLIHIHVFLFRRQLQNRKRMKEGKQNKTNRTKKKHLFK
jgi:hypothetical protein